MICKSNTCIHYKDGRCTLEKISIDKDGKCAAYKHIYAKYCVSSVFDEDYDEETVKEIIEAKSTSAERNKSITELLNKSK